MEGIAPTTRLEQTLGPTNGCLSLDLVCRLMERLVVFGKWLKCLGYPQCLDIPLPLLVRRNQKYDKASDWPFLTSAFGVFLLRQFFLTLPQDLIDAAKIDGAGPSLAALTIITFNGTWNNYFYPLIFLNTWEKMTLPLGITALRGYLASNSASVVMAAVSLAILPVLIIFLIAQNWFIAGITRTGIKG
ncbi:hypothetical protein BH10CHL1_BH10CHL1_25930 [soil metagenome]